MTPNKPDLRKQAEERLTNTHQDIGAMSLQEVEELVHEFQIHQIEIEMQNEELRAARDEIEAARDRFEELYDFAPVGYATVDRSGVVLEANLACASLLGCTRQDLIGTSLKRMVGVKDRKMLDRLLAETITQDQYQEADIQFLSPSPRTPTFSVRVSMGRTVAGEDPSWRLALVDVTARQQQAEDLRVAVAKAEHASQAKTRFLANMSHELRTPMNAVLGMTGVILAGALEDSNRGRLEVIRTSAEHLLGLLNELLDFSKIEAGKTELEPVDFPVKQVVGEAVHSLSAAAPSEIDIEILLSADVPARLTGDAGRIQQILSNLVSNAIKFTDRGRVRVRVGCERVWDEGVVLELKVEDTGIGISEENLPFIFDDFRQANTTIPRRFGGTGLGLSITRQLVELMGGRISVESELGAGTSFTVSLDLRLDEDQQKSYREQIRRTLGQQRVLFTGSKDAPGVSETLRLLRSWGVSVEHVVDREAAAVRIRTPGDEKTTPVVLLDPGTENSKQTPGMSIISLRTPPTPEELRRVLLASAVPVSVDCHPGMGRAAKQPRTYRRFDGIGVLLVDDLPINQRVGRDILEALGCSVEVASDGREAVRMQGAVAYDCVLMDCRMPGMDGYEATEAIRADEAELQKRVLIIALTAAALEEDRRRCFEAGMDDFVPKPITIEVVEELLGRHFGSSDGSPDGAALGFREKLAFQGRFTEMFADASLRAVERLGEAIETQQAKAVAEAAHALRGACGTLETELIMRLSLEIEEIGDGAGALTGLEPRFAQLEEEIKRVVRAARGTI